MLRKIIILFMLLLVGCTAYKPSAESINEVQVAQESIIQLQQQVQETPRLAIKKQLFLARLDMDKAIAQAYIVRPGNEPFAILGSDQECILLIH